MKATDKLRKLAADFDVMDIYGFTFGDIAYELREIADEMDTKISAIQKDLEQIAIALERLPREIQSMYSEFDAENAHLEDRIAELRRENKKLRELLNDILQESNHQWFELIDRMIELGIEVE